MAALGALALASGASLGALEARVVAGDDRALVLPPAGAIFEPYQNAGYRLTLGEGGAARIEVDLAPLASDAPFDLPPASAAAPGPVARLARALAAGATRRYEVVSRVLSWISANVRYDLDREADQRPESVLARRSAYCTGLARLATSMLAELGIEAREVPGYVAESAAEGPPVGFHRWIEVRYPDRGWVFSDPMATLHFVPATYLRLADDRLEDAPGAGRLLERRSRIDEVDLRPDPTGAGPRMQVRPNDGVRHAAALALRLEPAIDGEASLDGAGVRRRLSLPDGRGTFLGLEPGVYELRIEAEGRVAAHKRLTFRDRVLAELAVPVGAADRGEGGSRR
jgi:hypothetical protein